MNPFRGVDFYQADDLLSDVERMARDTVREWVGERVVPVIDTHFEDGTFPMHLIPEMAELGLFGANLPEEYGCAGMNNVAYGLVMQELERGDSGIRSFASVQGALVMYPIYTFGTEEQKRHWLPLLARGEKIGCFGLTEPDHGSDPGGMTTTAIRKGDRYVLNGTKSWITNGTIADVAVVWAKLDGQVTGFLVENGTSGFTAPEIRHKMSLRASITSQLIFEDCAIPEENLLPGSGGLASPLRCLNQARYGIAWGTIGAAMACYHAALEYSLERIQFDRPIGGFQLVQEKLVYMLTEITKAQLLALRLGRLKDENRIEHSQTSLAKRNNCAMALEVARMARDVLGANGISLEYPVIRHMCNLEAVKTYEGTHDIHTLILGQSITGQNAFR
ncbi:MAG: acyl-CoA dehydrogenase [Acidobacteria bacterium]|nr:acyl-CoA dehydrogenase [Acidobacteriota bacterium]